MLPGLAPRSIWQDAGSYPSGLGRKPVPVRFQLVIDCADPDRLARFWAAALGYELAPAPAGFATWNSGPDTCHRTTCVRPANLPS